MFGPNEGLVVLSFAYVEVGMNLFREKHRGLEIYPNKAQANGKSIQEQTTTRPVGIESE